MPKCRHPRRGALAGRKFDISPFSRQMTAMSNSLLRRRHWIIVLVSTFVAEQGNPAHAQPSADGTAALLSRLDLTKPGLEKVKAASTAEEVLSYYRTRTSVKHPIDRSLKKSSEGKYATARDIQTADNALKHIFVGQPAFCHSFRLQEL